ncbi:MAG: LPS export ABC transporter periplasmic protein LptC [Bacillota bacterium]
MARKKLIWAAVICILLIWHGFLWFTRRREPKYQKTQLEDKVPDRIMSTMTFPTLQVINARGWVEWDFTIKKTEIEADGALLSTVYGVYYAGGGGKPYLWITGDRAILSHNTRDIVFEGHIVVKTSREEQIETERLVWLADERKLHAQGDVKLTRRNVVTITDELVALLYDHIITTGPSRTLIMEDTGNGGK